MKWEKITCSQLPMDEKHARRRRIAARLKNDWVLYVLVLPVLAWYLIFCYAPMGGIILAFKDYSLKKGIWGSEWVGLQNFKDFFADKYLFRALKNTVIFGIGGILLTMPCEIGMALLLNELRMRKTKKAIQTVITFPHFLSWIIISGILINLLSSDGVISQIFAMMGMEYRNPITSESGYRWFIWLSAIWKEVGWGTIIYLAAIASVDQTMYEAAVIDGASRWQLVWKITLPAIRGTICIMLILAVGSILTNGRFDQIYNTYSAPIYSVADTFDTYVFRESFQTGGLDFGYSTAIGLVKSIVGVAMILSANKIVTAAGENGLV